MTVTTIANDDEADWRTRGACTATDADLHYADWEELVDEQGFAPDEAREFVTEATALAKAICSGCEIRSRCLAAAMANEEEHGIWGGKTAAERDAYRSAYAKIQKSQGKFVGPTVQKDLSALHNNPGVSFRYQQRAEQAQATINRLMDLPATWTLDTRKWLPDDAHYGVHSRDTLVQLFDLIRLHPEARADELARGMGKSTSWFNSLTRSCRRELGTDY